MPVKSTGGDEHVKRLEAVAESLKSYRIRFEIERDSRAVFTYIYELITRKLAGVLLDAEFADPEWVVALDEAFAARYFTAVEANNSGDEVPLGWQYVFKELARRRTSVLEDMLLGIVAHIVWDLPLALTDVGGSSISPHLADFHAINDILGGSIDTFQRSVAKRYNPLLNWLDRIGGSQDEILTNYGIRLSRGMAWYNAERLQDPNLREETLRSIGTSPEVVAKQILNPPALGLRFALRLVRIVLTWFRVWPNQVDA